MRGEYDELAVSIVVDERVAMRLRGADRVEALRRLDALGVPTATALLLLRWPIDPESVCAYRRRHQLPGRKLTRTAP